jgi:hypothetical protein
VRALQHPAVVLLACLGVTLLAYGPSLSDGFYNDDALFLNHAGRVLEQPARLLTERPLDYFRPTYGAFVTVQRAAFGLEPRGYHLVGVLLHALTGLLVWRLARLALKEPVPALAAALVFVAFFSHSEGVLWIAAQNSVLAVCLCLGAVLCNLWAASRGGAGRALASAALVLLALCTKEPSAVLLAWLPLTEAVLCGPRRLLTGGALLRYGTVAAALALWLLGNARVGEAFLDEGATGTRELRATLGFVTLDGALGASAWLYSPLVHGDEQAHWWAGALALLGVLGVTALRRRDLLPAALLGVLLLLSAMVPASMTRLQQINSSRLYYFPTVGAALLAGVVMAWCTAHGAGARAGASAGASAGSGGGALRWVGALALVAYLLVLTSAVRDLDRRDYAPVSRDQTRLAVQLGERLGADAPRAVLLIEPWIDNPMHLAEFVQLYAGRAPERVGRQGIPRAEADAWLTRQRRLEPDVPVLDWSEAEGLVPATGAPVGNRDSAPGNPRREAELSAASRFEVLRLEWRAR